uniref:Metallo-beta-lactamase domain-containing protein n=1 Tax=Chenopodium quinoa TaxID=63459 RepID=A0A803KUX8_CHEQI
MSIYKLAVIIKNPLNDEEFLAVKQIRPRKFGIEEYDSYIDSDLWDFPSVQLSILQGESEIQVEGAELCASKLDLKKFDLGLALNQISEQVGIERLVEGQWKFWKFVEEPEFGPGPPIHTVFITGYYGVDDKSCDDLQNSFSDDLLSITLSLLQEYPLGVRLVPMESRTGKPFSTTNLVVIAPQLVANRESGKGFIAHGDALIIDPGCKSRLHQELADIIAALPRKLVVFVTHHHPDHVDGLSAIQKCNPDAILLAHENTMHRIGKDDWSLGYTPVAGGEEINIGGQRLQVIFAPGHTDGHMALLHVNTYSLIVGDHCVGQGSAVLDAFSGGNMREYFNTTYKFLELSPNTLIPMHGRVNLWPKHMLCRYLKNRRDRESSILSAIENGSTTLFGIVSTIYKDVDRVLWFVAASNVRLHVEHLAQQHKLPEGMSLTKFHRTFGFHFAINWIWAYTCNWISSKVMKIRRPKLIVLAVVACFVALYCSLGSLSMFALENSSFLEDVTVIQISLASSIKLSGYGSETLAIG